MYTKLDVVATRTDMSPERRIVTKK